MEAKTELAMVHGLGRAEGLQPRGYSRKAPDGDLRDCPDVGENSLNLFTLSYSELIEALSDTLFPPNQVTSTRSLLKNAAMTAVEGLYEA